MSTRVGEEVPALVRAAVEATADADILSWECFPTIFPTQTGPMMGWVVVLMRPAVALDEQHFVLNLIQTPKPAEPLVRQTVAAMVEQIRTQHAQAVRNGLLGSNGHLGPAQGETMPLRPPGGAPPPFGQN